MTPESLPDSFFWQALRFGGLRWLEHDDIPSCPHVTVLEEAEHIYRTMMDSDMVRKDYVDVYPPESFFDAVVLPIRLLRRGQSLIAACGRGFVWNLTRHRADVDLTTTYWMERLNRCTTPDAATFSEVACLDDPALDPIRQAAIERKKRAWTTHIAQLSDRKHIDWERIIKTTDASLTEVAAHALERHNAVWIAALQAVTSVDHRLLKEVRALDPIAYKPTHDEALFVKMRVWQPLDADGQRIG